MAITVANEPDPRTLGAYAFEAGRQPAIRENLVESRRLAQQQGQFDAQQAANAQQLQQKLQADANQQAASNARDMYEEQAKQAGYEKLNQAKAKEAELNRAAQWQNNEANRQQKEQLAYEDRVAKGLKDGSLYYDPRQKQQLSELDKNIAQVSNDPSIADDQREQMLDVLTRQRRSVIPSVRSVEDRPVPLEEKMASGTVVLTDDGQVIPLAKLGRGLRPGEKLGTSTTRNGTEQFKWEDAVKPQKTEAEKPTPEQKAWGNPVSAMQLENGIRTQLQSRIDVEYKNKLAEWKQREQAHKAAEQAKVKEARDATVPSTYTPKPFGEKAPQQRVPSQEEVGHELYRRSGGLQGIMPPEQAAEMLQGMLGTMSGASREAGQKMMDLLLGATPARPGDAAPAPAAAPATPLPPEWTDAAGVSSEISDRAKRQLEIGNDWFAKGNLGDAASAFSAARKAGAGLTFDQNRLAQEHDRKNPPAVPAPAATPAPMPNAAPIPVQPTVPMPNSAPVPTERTAPMPNAMPPAGQFNEIKRPPNVPVSAVFVRSDDEATFNRLPPGTAVYDENGEGGIK